MQRYLNGRLGDFGRDEVERRYSQQVSMHRDILLSEWKYARRNLPHQAFPWEPRSNRHRGAKIKFESVRKIIHDNFKVVQLR